MRRFRRPALLIVIALLAAGGSHAIASLGRSADDPSRLPAMDASAQPAITLPQPDPIQPLAEVDAALAVWSANLERNDADFISAVRVAELYLGRARLTADPADLERSVAAIDTALAIDPDLLSGRLLRAQVALARHDFADARDQAAEILVSQPGLAAALAIRGDAELELGAYDAAASTYADLRATAPGPAATARLARLAALTGRLDEARDLATDALTDATRSAAQAADLAWYHTLGGSLAFQAGDLAAARSAYDMALEAWPGSAAALAGLARTRAAQGAHAEAIELYERSVAIVPAIDALAALGDLRAAAGDRDAADAALASVRAIGELSGAAGLHDRQLALFLANHAENAAGAVRIAEADLERRQDVYAHDTLAWALHAAGRTDEAAMVIAEARRLGTEDALLDYHAGVIAAELGHRDEAAALLAEALDRNQAFDPIHAPRAAALLAELEAAR